MTPIELRWKQAHARENLLAWHALSTWLSAEALMASIDGDMATCADLWTLSDVAHQHKIDLQPEKVL
jgi:hypothetical protein